MILVGTISSAQAVRREDLPKPDMDISQLGGIVLSSGSTSTMEISQLNSVVLNGTAATDMDISQLSSVVLHGTEF